MYLDDYISEEDILKFQIIAWQKCIDAWQDYLRVLKEREVPKNYAIYGMVKNKLEQFELRKSICEDTLKELRN